MKMVYVDNAASTPIRDEVFNIMKECNQHYGNPSCIHKMGQKSRELIENARKQIADSICAKPNEIIFTSGGTESNNFALQGIVNENMGGHIITTQIEHLSVLNPIKYLQREGCEVTYLPVDNDGKINIRQLQRSIRRNTILISIMFANNEIGTLQPIKEIGDIARQYGICFHTDAVQAFSHYNINVNELNIDMMSLSGHKIYAPKGIGVLYVKNDINLIPMIHGSGQEFNLRSGTENVNSIVGMGKATELLNKTEKEHIESNLLRLKNRLIGEITEKIPNIKINGSKENSLPGIVNISFAEIEGETLVTMLSEKGIYASNSAACLYSHLEPSHVLSAIGVPDFLAYGSVRFSFGKYNTEDDIDYIMDVLPDLVEKIRKGNFKI